MVFMAASRLVRYRINALPLLAFLVILVASAYFLIRAAQDSAFFSEWYSVVLVLNALCIIALFILIFISLFRLVKQYRFREMGSRLTSRLVVMFILLAIVPTSFIYYFSLRFLDKGIDSWFDRHIEAALSDALDLSRTALDDRMREVLRQTDNIAMDLSKSNKKLNGQALVGLDPKSSILELTLFSMTGHIMAANSVDPTRIVPSRPNESVFLQLRQGRDYVGLEPISESGLFIRAVVNVPRLGRSGDTYILQSLLPVDERIGVLAQRVEDAFSRYKGMIYLRRPLKSSFVLTLSLALLQSLLTAVWLAFYFARKIVEPIRILAMGMHYVAAGNYEQQLPPQNNDELGSLIESFNDMTRRVSIARDEAKINQKNVEQQKIYIETVLTHLSSGVMTFDNKRRLRTVNEAASKILQSDVNKYVGFSLKRWASREKELQPLLDVLFQKIESKDAAWHGEVMMYPCGVKQILICRGSQLPPVSGSLGGYVLVFDDITSFVQAQKNAAWGEVARRLAHEIKNPLTPIQLSAERLRDKYLGSQPDRDTALLDKATRTIVNQVESMKDMVRAFSDYAQALPLQLQALDLNHLIIEILDLYHNNDGVSVVSKLAQNLPAIKGDEGRLRQLLHNLLKNAFVAVREKGSRVTITTYVVVKHSVQYVELVVQDDGPGLPKEHVEQVFEPYFTTKTKGTGLGLAIVKKIVEEHNGQIMAENAPLGGARFVIFLPIDELLLAAFANHDEINHDR